MIASSLFICSCDSTSDAVVSRINNTFDTIADNITDISDPVDDPSDQQPASSNKRVDPDFQSIVDRFVIEANKRNVSVDLDGLDIQYGNTDGAYGECSYIGTDTKDIVITPDLRNSPDDLKDEIVLHELGHCILGRKHSSNPSSIMHATNIIGEPWRTEVLDELFSL